MQSFLVSITALAALFTSAAARAEVTATKKSLTNEGAKRVIAAAVAEAKRLNTTGVIAVVDDGGNLMALERLDETFAAGALISYGKARTSALFKKPTRAFEEIIRGGRTPMVALSDFTPLQGGVPLMIDGQVVGAVGVSGAASAQQDEELAVAGAKAVANPSAAAAPITYIDRARVAEGFSTGAILFDGRPLGANYEVHASRRSAPGQAEVHANETDVIYVLDGEATLVTGGTVVEPSRAAAAEIRGKEILGGQEHLIARGDVIIVPAGTPHWFKLVPGTIQYYVVKVVR
jgi:glc operon protein GlcG